MRASASFEELLLFVVIQSPEEGSSYQQVLGYAGITALSKPSVQGSVAIALHGVLKEALVTHAL